MMYGVEPKDIRAFFVSSMKLIAEEAIESGRVEEKETTHQYCDAYANHSRGIDRYGNCRDEVDEDNKIEGWNSAREESQKKSKEWMARNFK